VLLLGVVLMGVFINFMVYGFNWHMLTNFRMQDAVLIAQIPKTPVVVVALCLVLLITRLSGMCFIAKKMQKNAPAVLDNTGV
jgi:hypothetical protein